MIANSRMHYLPEKNGFVSWLLTAECFPYTEASLGMEVRALVGWAAVAVAAAAAAGWVAAAAGKAPTRRYSCRRRDALRLWNSTTGKHTSVNIHPPTYCGHAALVQ
jgi:hypothetical protein